MTRRRIGLVGWIGSFVLLLLGAASPGAASGGAAHARADREARPLLPIVAWFSGERLDYDVSVLFFSRAAASRLTLEPAPAAGSGASLADGDAGTWGGRYVARATIETKGFVGWLNRRRHVYTSSLVPCEEGRRWCTRRFVMDLTDGGHREVRTTSIDPARGLVTWTVERDGAVVETGREPMQPGRRYDDMLAALYNLRAGAYGPIERGRRYEIETLPLEGVGSFAIRVLAGAEEAEARRKFDFGEGGFVIAARIPKAIFGREGEAFAWLSPDLVPLRGAVEQYIGFGDVHGRLVGATRPADALAARGR
ncbi:MAG TPA: DUF3108 domain-containing protein [Thermodesulfobacteriota bacterium]